MLNDGDIACRCHTFRDGMGHLGGVRWFQSPFSPCKPAKVLDIPSAAASGLVSVPTRQGKYAQLSELSMSYSETHPSISWISHGFGKVTRGGAVRTPRRTGDSPPYLGSAC
jgi:hypothetical protein